MDEKVKCPKCGVKLNRSSLRKHLEKNCPSLNPLFEFKSPQTSPQTRQETPTWVKRVQNVNHNKFKPWWGKYSCPHCGKTLSTTLIKRKICYEKCLCTFKPPILSTSQIQSPTSPVSTPTIIATTSEIDESNTEFTVADVLYYLKDRTTLTTEHGKLEYAVEKYILGIDHLKDTPHESGPNYDDEEVRGNRAYITKKIFEGFDELGRKYKGRDTLHEILEYEFELWAIELNKEVITKNYVPTDEEQTRLKGWFKVLRNQARIQDTYPGLIRYMIESPIPDRIRKQ